LKKIVLLTSAGLYDDALNSIPKVVDADSNRGLFIPSRLQEINFLKRSIQAQRESESGSGHLK